MTGLAGSDVGLDLRGFRGGSVEAGADVGDAVPVGDDDLDLLDGRIPLGLNPGASALALELADDGEVFADGDPLAGVDPLAVRIALAFGGRPTVVVGFLAGVGIGDAQADAQEGQKRG